MQGQVYQLSPMSCGACGMGGNIPKEETYFDRYTKETVTEAVWICRRCGTRIDRGVCSRVKENE